jgi:hypothetical protein
MGKATVVATADNKTTFHPFPQVIDTSPFFVPG